MKRLTIGVTILALIVIVVGYFAFSSHRIATQKCDCLKTANTWMYKYITEINPKLSPDQIDIFLYEIDICSKISGFDPEMLLSVAKVESKFRPSAVHPISGAMGMFQINPSVWPDATLDIVHNTRAGCRRLISYSDQHKGLLSLTLKAYNGGGKNFSNEVFKVYSEISQKSLEEGVYGHTIDKKSSSNR